MDDHRFLLSLIREGEHQQQDFKYRVADACKLAKSVSAFANTDGGRLMHQAAYKYCKPEPSIQFDTYHAEGRTIVVATVPPSPRRPVLARNEEGRMIAYIRIKDENIVASPVHLALWREGQKPQGSVTRLDDDIHQLLDAMKGTLTLSQIVRLSRLPRHKVVSLLARLVRFGNVRWEYTAQQFLFSLT